MRSVLNCGSLALAACMSLAFCGTFAVANAEEKSAGQEKVKLGWKSMDIGKVGKNGSFSEKDGIFTVTGSGEDIWTGGDAFRFAYIPVKGDMELVAEVASLKTSHPWAKTGIMLRANLDFDSRFAFTSVTPNNGAYFFRRTGVVHEVGYSRKQDVKAPCWLKLSRNGNLFTSSISNDGKTWSQIGSVEVAMSTYAYAGLAVCSHKSDVLDTATLKNVSFKGEILPEDKDPAALAAEEKKAANAASGLEQKLAEIDALAAKLRASRASLSFQPRKKLICAGHDMKNMTPLKIREQITQMQQSPFDGLAIRLKGAENGFNSRAFDEERFLEDYQSLAAIEWGHFTDNFIWMHCTSQLEWFNEKDWQGVLANARIMAKAALLGRCAGIVFDAETYGAHPWSYSDAVHRGDKTFEEYEARARKCGREWMEAVQEVCPNIRILTCFMPSNENFILDYFYSVGSDKPLTEKSLNMNKLRKGLPNEHYALLPAFANGMLEAAKGKTIIINGNEGAYYYQKQADYLKYRKYADEFCARAFFDPALRERYKIKFRLGSTYYGDFYYPGGFGGYADHLTPEESARWTEHNVYWALNTSDEYVWEWTEELFDWWSGKLPPKFDEAVRSAKKKIDEGKPLGFESDILFKGMFERAKSQIPEIKLSKTATSPKIDGCLDDVVWKGSYVSGPFLSRWSGKINLNAKTRVMLCRDEANLYVGIVCEEPHMDLLKAEKKDSFDDKVVILLSSSTTGLPCRKIAINPYGKTNDKTEWQTAAQIGDKSWTVEVVIPLAELGVSAEQGAKFRLNVGRDRKVDGEHSSWSPTFEWYNNFMEPDYFAKITLE